MTTDAHDPFDDLALPIEPQDPRPSFARTLRARIVADLGLDDELLPQVQLPERKPTMTTTEPPTTIATTVTPYLAVHDGAAALDWYATAFGAVEQMRVVGDDGRLGHAEFHVGDAVFYLSDEYPDLGVSSPRTLGGTPFAVHLTVTDVDSLYTQAVDAGATTLSEPADQPHGSRHGTLLDPFGHRWMLSQLVEQLSVDDYAARSEGSGYTVVTPDTADADTADADTADADIPGLSEGETIAAAQRPGTGSGIWAAVFYEDALAGIRFLVDTFGFTEQLVVVGQDSRTVVHSQLRWPEGGIVQAGSYDPDNIFSHAPGEQSLYVVTADPQSVWERCQAAGLDVIREPSSPDHDPEGMGFTVRDHERNLWSFGTYGLGQDGE